MLDNISHRSTFPIIHHVDPKVNTFFKENTHQRRKEVGIMLGRIIRYPTNPFVEHPHYT